MAHLNDLPGTLPQWLGNANLKVNPILKWKGRAKIVTSYNADGSPNFSASYYDVTVDLTNRIDPSGIGITMDKPILPQDGDENKVKASQVTINLINTDTHFATTQTGATIDINSIEGGKFYVWLNVPGASPAQLDMYRGRCVAIPDEEFGLTRFTIRDIFWEALKKPIVYDALNGISGNVLNFNLPNTYVSGNTLINQTTEIVYGQGYLQNYDGYTAWTEDGEIITTVDVSDRTKVELKDIEIKNKCPLGIFTITFGGGLAFRISYPDGGIYQGNTGADFTSPFINIKASYWAIGQNITDLKGEKITFQTRVTYYGNPISLIKLFIERAFMQNHGSLPSNTYNPSYPAINLPVRWDTFNALETQWWNYRVYFSEGNKSNDVFEKKATKPLNYLSVIQRIADHIGASIMVDNLGRIYIQSAKIGQASNLHDLTGGNAIIKGSFSINSNRKPNLIRLNYGRNDRTDAYGAFKEVDLRTNPDYDIEEYNLNLPYFKAGSSKFQAEEIQQMYIKRNLRSLVTVSFDVTPQYGLSMMPGDRVRIISTKQPKIIDYFEIFQVSKRIGINKVSVQAFKTQTPEGILPTLCNWTLCEDILC